MPEKAHQKSQQEVSKELRQLGARIKYLRQKKGFKSYEQFAYEHEINRVQWGRYENGENLKFQNLVRVVNALGVSLKEFFSEGFE